MNIVFGPVPSRRLGRSLGVNNIPYKICSYNCVYCQLGKTIMISSERKKFYSPELIYDQVKEKLNELKNERIDYITFVPDGEPTLDINIGNEAKMLKDFGKNIAVLTNSSLMNDENVREDLLNFDLVSFKVDAISYEIWKTINRPDKKIILDEIMKGMLDFRESFNGKIISETMIIEGIDYEKELIKISDFLEVLDPDVAYIGIPIRPPAEEFVLPAKEETINKAYQIFSKKLKKVELLIGYEGDEFSSTGNFEEDLLSIVSVHPMREDALMKFLMKENKSMKDVEKLIDEGKIVVLDYEGHKFYFRKPRK